MFPIELILEIILYVNDKQTLLSLQDLMPDYDIDIIKKLIKCETRDEIFLIYKRYPQLKKQCLEQIEEINELCEIGTMVAREFIRKELKPETVLIEELYDNIFTYFKCGFCRGPGHTEDEDNICRKCNKYPCKECRDEKCYRVKYDDPLGYFSEFIRICPYQCVVYESGKIIHRYCFCDECEEIYKSSCLCLCHKMSEDDSDIFKNIDWLDDFYIIFYEALKNYDINNGNNPFWQWLNRKYENVW